jgi:hypothetical protein
VVKSNWRDNRWHNETMEAERQLEHGDVLHAKGWDKQVYGLIMDLS